MRFKLENRRLSMCEKISTALPNIDNVISARLPCTWPSSITAVSTSAAPTNPASIGAGRPWLSSPGNKANMATGRITITASRWKDSSKTNKFRDGRRINATGVSKQWITQRTERHIPTLSSKLRKPPVIFNFRFTRKVAQVGLGLRVLSHDFMAQP